MRLTLLICGLLLAGCLSAKVPSPHPPPEPAPNCPAGGWGAQQCSFSISESLQCRVSCPGGYFACCSDEDGRPHCRCLPATDFEPDVTDLRAPQEATDP